MQRIVSAVGAISLLVSSSVSAYTYPKSDPRSYKDWVWSMGLDYKFSSVGKRGDWEDLLPTHHNGGTIFINARFHRNFAVEYGYSFTDKSSRNKIINNGQSILGITNSSGMTHPTNGRLRFKHSHFDLRVYAPMRGDFELYGILGVTSSRQTLQVITTAENNDSFDSTLRFIEGRSAVLYHLGVGFKGMFTKQLGWRAEFDTENTGRIKVRGNVNEDHPFDNMFSASVGLYLQF